MPKALPLSRIFTLIAIFLVIAVAQTPVWLYLPITDGESWINSARGFARSGIPPEDVNSVHPGATILVPVGILLRTGIDGAHTLVVVMVFWTALLSTLICGLCYRLRPESLWWLCALCLLVLNQQYTIVTPPTVIASLLTALWFLLLMTVRESETLGRRTIIALGVCAGVMAATRIDTALLVGALSAPHLIWTIHKRIVIVAAIALATWYVCDPYLWVQPLEHMAGIFSQAHANISFPFGNGNGLLLAPLACLSFVFGMVCLFRRELSPVPLDFLAWLMGATVLGTVILLFPAYHPMRYFFPLIVTWDILLPLFVLKSFDSANFSRTARNFGVGMIFILLIAARVVPMLF